MGGLSERFSNSRVSNFLSLQILTLEKAQKYRTNAREDSYLLWILPYSSSVDHLFSSFLFSGEEAGGGGLW